MIMHDGFGECPTKLAKDATIGEASRQIRNKAIDAANAVPATAIKEAPAQMHHRPA